MSLFIFSVQRVFNRAHRFKCIQRQLASTKAQEDIINDCTGPQAQYQKHVDNGLLISDSHQMEITKFMNGIHDELKMYHRPKVGFFQKFLKSKPQVQAPKGLYLYGSVGCGKTMLMDLFYDTCPVEKKRRIHFHNFMLNTHAKMHDLKKNVSDRVRGSKEWFDPIPPVAKAISDDTWLLCFDEFQVTDIADAMILKRLFTELFRNGVTMVATSNRCPEDLYKNGLQRSNFLPFIDILKNNCYCLQLDSGIDYRQKAKKNKRTFFILTDETVEEEIRVQFKILSSQETDVVRPRILSIKGRNVNFSNTCGGVLDSTFDELCKRELGAIDYIHLSQIFHTVFIKDIPQLTQQHKTEARRFITLIDTLYDYKVRVICSSVMPHEKIFQHNIGNTIITDSDRMLMDDLKISKDSENADSNIFTGSEEAFAFDRTISRLSEMQTSAYWDQCVVC